MDKPKLRRLLAYPAFVNGAEQLVIEDPLRMSPRLTYAGMDALLILECFDGRNTLEDIQAVYLAKAGAPIKVQTLQQLVQQLDQNLMLDNARFADERARMLQAWRAARQRPPLQAGLSYPKEPAEITARFDKYLKDAGGPEKIPVDKQPPLALIAPGADPRMCGAAAVTAYQQLRGRGGIELFVILASAHHPMTYRACGLRKDVMTPYGAAATDVAFLEAVGKGLPFSFFADEWAHRAEHAIEFQTVFLQWLFGGSLRAKVAPIIVNRLLPPGGAGPSPRQDKATAGFLEALGREVAQRRGKVCVIAGVELAHLGGRFGDQVPMNEQRRKALADRDRETLDAIVSCDAEKFHAAIVKDQNNRRITGHAAIYTLLAALKPARGQFLRYGQFHEPNTNTVTSFAAAAFYA
jgi:hypothetical protein